MNKRGDEELIGQWITYVVLASMVIIAFVFAQNTIKQTQYLDNYFLAEDTAKTIELLATLPVKGEVTFTLQKGLQLEIVQEKEECFVKVTDKTKDIEYKHSCATHTPPHQLKISKKKDG